MPTPVPSMGIAPYVTPYCTPTAPPTHLEWPTHMRDILPSHDESRNAQITLVAEQRGVEYIPMVYLAPQRECGDVWCPLAWRPSRRGVVPPVEACPPLLRGFLHAFPDTVIFAFGNHPNCFLSLTGSPNTVDWVLALHYPRHLDLSVVWVGERRSVDAEATAAASYIPRIGGTLVRLQHRLRASCVTLEYGKCSLLIRRYAPVVAMKRVKIA